MNSSTKMMPGVERLRHPLKVRLAQVRRTQRLTPSLQRVTLTGEDLSDFYSPSFDDHVKLFFPSSPDAMPVLPVSGPDGPRLPEGASRPVTRDYTPRRYDAAKRELDVDFVLHEGGLAAAWALQARAGQYLGVGGPRGSFLVSPDFAWHVLIGDETALPAIARRLEELPEGKRVFAIIETAHADGRLELETCANLSLQWVNGVSTLNEVNELERAAQALQLPEGDGFVWAAGEYLSIRAIRQHFVQDRGLDKARIRASSYWRKGSDDAHETFDD